MENATQALLIVGGILLGIMTISLLVYMFSNMATIGNAQAEREAAEQLSKWNAEWEAYNKNYLYGAEVLTVWNKANQHNKENIYGEENKVEITGVTLERLLETKSSIYECTKVTYNKKTGRVNGMNFKFVE